MGPSPSLAGVRDDAMRLAADLPGVLLEARRLASAAPGVHGRRRAGLGEDFWQFRDYRDEDGARRVDWRRSGRGERLYVREREMEAAQSAHFWLDQSAGFNWSSAPKQRPTKAHRALVLSVAAGMVLSRAGERVGVVGGRSFRGGGAGERLADALLAMPAAEPALPPVRGCVALLSDFYAPLDVWRDRLQQVGRQGAFGVLVMVADPAEEDFPFSGRVRFRDTAPGGSEALFGRADEAKAAYQARLAEHRAGLRALAEPLGFPVLSHRTDRPAGLILTALCTALSERRR